jgi:integrase|tara:strand:- start:14950 stop:16212 length:1263 start_codon:yes stop_codon:yes gene_type:complete
VFTPIFDTRAEFISCSEDQYLADRPELVRYLNSFDGSVDVWGDYRAARGFLKSNSRVETTYNNYRTQVERLLMWCWLKRKKPFRELLRSDVEAFLDFCCNPDPEWIGTAIKGRFILSEGVFIPNAEWRPFSKRVPKSKAKLAAENLTELPAPAFSMSAGSIRQVYAAMNSLFSFCNNELLMSTNPCLQLGKNKSQWTSRTLQIPKSKAITKLQWEFVIETAEEMADESPATFERTLFIIVMMISCYLRVSDLAGNAGWQPTMGCFVKGNDGWWYHVVGKGNVHDKVAVKPDCMTYLARYRRHLNLPPTPSPGETEPLLRTKSGRSGLTARQIRRDVQKVLDRALAKMIKADFSEEEVDSLRSATLHWFRHTGATFDAPYRNPKNLQMDMRHKRMSTTQDIYYNAQDDERIAEVARLTVKR